MKASRLARRGFSLIELVIVVVIIGIIAAIAIPRMSRGSQGASEGALVANLTVLRNAIELYETEHGKLPDDLVPQMTEFSNAAGDTQATRGGDFVFGPYLRAIPAIPVGAQKGTNTVTTVTGAATVPPSGTSAWWYNSTTGDIRANTAATSQGGTAFTSF